MAATNIEDDGFPFKLYVYGADGKHGGATIIADDVELHALFASDVKSAIRDRLEVRITDSGDDCVFHAKEGHIIWPTGLANR